MINQKEKDEQILDGIYAEWDRAERKYDERNLPEARHKAKKRGAKFERKNITSCTHCGDTYSVDDALGFTAFDFGIDDIEKIYKTKNFFYKKQCCLNCNKLYYPFKNFRLATMDKWIYDMHKGCKGG